MINRKIYFSICVFIGLITATLWAEDDNRVAHKNTDINGYLNQISSEQEEKTRILSHILNNPNGTYLDMGTGGDSVAVIVKSLPQGSTASILAADIDQGILDAIPERHPEIKPFMNDADEDKPKVKLIKMDASNMKPINDSSIDGISASALAHEVFSYVPTKTGLDQFFIEVSRVLKPGGVFVYRDPRWDTNPYQDCLLIITNSMAKNFITLFLPRFLDRFFSNRIDYQGKCIKPPLYDKSHIRFNFFYKNSGITKKATLEEFIKIPLCAIDFNKNISLEVPRGLISEIQRHYILFIKNIFITDIIDKNFFEKNYILLNEMPKEEREILEQFLSSHQIKTQKISTSLDVFSQMVEEKRKLFELLSHGVWLQITDKEEVESFCRDLYLKDIGQNQIYVHGNMLWIDAKLAALLYQGKNKSFLKGVNNDSSCPYSVFEWLKREGEEFYFYKTTDEIITYAGQLTQHYLKETDKEGYVLCPIDSAAIQHATRNLYKSIVESHMSVMDIDGNKQDIIFDKNIIHFCLMKKEQALAIYKKIVNSSDVDYPELKRWLKHDLS